MPLHGPSLSLSHCFSHTSLTSKNHEWDAGAAPRICPRVLVSHRHYSRSPPNPPTSLCYFPPPPQRARSRLLIPAPRFLDSTTPRKTRPAPVRPADSKNQALLERERGGLAKSARRSFQPLLTAAAAAPCAHEPPSHPRLEYL